MTSEVSTRSALTWIATILTPDEDRLRKEVVRLQSSIDSLHARQHELSRRADEARWQIDLLHQTGTPFARCASRALRALGLDIEELFHGVKTDAIATLRGSERRFFAIEYKGLERSAIDVQGIRQANEWVERTKISKGTPKVKGVLIANSSRLHPVDRRSGALPHDVEQTARVLEIAVIRAEELYELVLYHQSSKRLLSQVWKKVWSSSGYINLKVLVTPDSSGS